MNDKTRSLLAVALSVGVLVVWMFFMSPQTKQSEPQTQVSAATAVPATAAVPQQALLAEVAAVRPAGQECILENEVMKVTFDASGGIAKGWELKKYSKNGEEASQNVNLVDARGDVLELHLRGINAKIPNPIPFSVAAQNFNSVDFRWESKELVLWKKLRLDPNSYLVHMDVEVNNRGKETIIFTPSIHWSMTPVEESPQRGVLFFKTPPDRWQPAYSLDGSMEKPMVEELAASKSTVGKVGWIGATSRYFLGSLLPLRAEGQMIEEGFSNLAGGEQLFFTRMNLPSAQVGPGESWSQKFNVFGGPKEYALLKAVGPGMEKAIGYGWTTVIAIPILYLLKFFYGLIHNYGIAIILLTVLVKLMLNPINRKSLESMKGMQTVQPKIKELQKKYGNDKQRLNTEMMQLFKNNKINPMGGCLPMLLQFPIYIALYNVLWNSVELYHAPFLWFYKDLSAPDPYLITPIVLGVAMFVQTKMTPSPSADPAQQKIMLLMPLMFCGIMVFLPMGLGLYILVNTVMTILQQKMYQKGIRFRDVLRGKFA